MEGQHKFSRHLIGLIEKGLSASGFLLIAVPGKVVARYHRSRREIEYLKCVVLQADRSVTVSQCNVGFLRQFIADEFRKGIPVCLRVVMAPRLITDKMVEGRQLVE